MASNYKIDPVSDVNGHASMLVSWQGQGTPTKIRLGITNNNGFSGYGYGISYGNSVRVSEGAWGSGPVGVSQSSAPATGALTLPVYITPCYLTRPLDPPPQGITWFNSIAPLNDGTVTFMKDNDPNAGITIAIQAGGGGGDDDE